MHPTAWVHRHEACTDQMRKGDAMKTKLNVVEEPQTPKLQETLVRDSKQVKVKTRIRCGIIAVKTIP
jgi:hypothetical protein